MLEALDRIVSLLPGRPDSESPVMQNYRCVRNELRQRMQANVENFARLVMEMFSDISRETGLFDKESDRYLQTVNESSNLESFINLLGAFEYNGNLIPVEFGLKRSKDNSQRVYIVATIKEDPLNAPTAKSGHGAKAGSSYAVSIEDVIRNVKPNDGYSLPSERVAMPSAETDNGEVQHETPGRSFSFHRWLPGQEK